MSKLLLILGVLLWLIAGSLFYFGIEIAESQSNPQELMTRVGEVSGVLIGVGFVMLIVSFLKRRRTA